MIDQFSAGDFLVFQVESGFGLLRLLHIEDRDEGIIWHVSLYKDFFPNIDAIEAGLVDPSRLTVESSHIAMTNRAFESTQLTKLGNQPLSTSELSVIERIRTAAHPEVMDRSIRLLLGIR